MAKTNATTVLLDGTVTTTEQEDGYTVTRFCLSGDAHAKAIVGAVADAYPATWGEAPLDGLVAGDKVTLLLRGESAFGSTAITAVEGTVFNGSRGLAYLPKGKRKNGYGLNPDKVLDVLIGYGKTPELKRRVDEVRARFPEVVALTTERLAELPDRGKTCNLAVFGRLSLGGETTHEALWLLHSYMKEDDIAEGVLIVTERVGFSEHGSSYGKDLVRMGGEVVGFKPMSLKDALELSNGTASEALAAVVAASKEEVA